MTETTRTYEACGHPTDSGRCINCTPPRAAGRETAYCARCLGTYTSGHRADCPVRDVPLTHSSREAGAGEVETELDVRALLEACDAFYLRPDLTPALRDAFARLTLCLHAALRPPAGVRETLEYARDVFDSYVKLHAAKGTESGALKAGDNYEHAQRMREALSALPPAGRREAEDTAIVNALEAGTLDVVQMGTTVPFRIIEGPGGTFTDTHCSATPITFREACARALSPLLSRPEHG